jgi:hypothetical protein
MPKRRPPMLLRFQSLFRRPFSPILSVEIGDYRSTSASQRPPHPSVRNFRGTRRCAATARTYDRGWSDLVQPTWEFQNSPCRRRPLHSGSRPPRPGWGANHRLFPFKREPWRGMRGRKGEMGPRRPPSHLRAVLGLPAGSGQRVLGQLPGEQLGQAAGPCLVAAPIATCLPGFRSATLRKWPT